MSRAESFGVTGLKQQSDWIGKGIGLGVFCLGIIGLVVVFVLTARMTGPGMAAGQSPDLRWAAGLGVDLFKLFICGLVSSWIAGRGAQLYAAASRNLLETTSVEG